MRPGIIDLDTGRELWNAVQCADYCGMNRSTWTTYVSRHQADVPDAVATLGRFTLWDAEEVRAWHSQRPSIRSRSTNR